MNIKATLAFAALTAFLAPAAMAVPIIVDDFSAAGTRIADLQGNPAFVDVADAGILGGNRFMWVSTDGTQDLGTGISANGDGQVNFNNDTGATGQAVLIYDGGPAGRVNQMFNFADSPTNQIGVNTGGLGGVNLVKGSVGTTSFKFDILSFDAGGIVQFWAYAWDTFGNLATYDEELANPGPQISIDNKLGLSQFTTPVGFDWTSIGALAFSVESKTPEFDGALGTISVIPLPASAFLLLGGLGGLFGVSAASRRRRRKA
ncbi:hypothetical protein [Marinovum sp.]|uniref:hypothetical protein n=1 Tax=Marinovum sp. TaxID=2024839 RepID=UPI003A913142